MTVTTDGRSSCTAPTTASAGAPAAAVRAGVGTGRVALGGALSSGWNALRETRYVAATPPERPPRITATSNAAARRARLTSLLSARRACDFGAGGLPLRATTPCGGPDCFRFDHLPDGGRAPLQIHVRVRLDHDIPRARHLELLVDALEALLRIGDRIDRLRRDLAGWIGGERDVEMM